MDFLFELLFGLFVEVPMDAALESKRLKPWVKTALVFIVGNLLTALLAFIFWQMYKEGPMDGSVIVIGALTVAWFLFISIACIYGHRNSWRDKVKPRKILTVEQKRNMPNPDITIRTAHLTDLDAIAAVEAECFPAAEAATREEFADRLRYYANHFWLMFDGDKLVSFVDGFVTDEPDLTDEMYADASLHNEAGDWQMIFGVNTIPAYRNHGYAAQLIEQAILDAKEQGRKGVVLTCKPEKVPYYLKFGFQNEGISQSSTHGGAIWHQMRLTF